MKIPNQVLYGRLLLAVAAGLVCAAMSYFQWVLPLDRMAYDMLNERRPAPRADDLLIVAIDERSLQQLGRWPWPREKHVELLRQLHRAGAAAVAMDILFAERDVAYPQVDELLGTAMAEQGSVVLPVFIGQANRRAQLREILPLQPIAEAAAGLGHVHIEVDSDGVARSVFLQEGVGQPRWPHFTVALSRVLGLDIAELPGVIDAQVLAHPDPTAIIRSHANLIPFMGPAGTVDQISYVDVMAGKVRQDLLRDKIIFVGATAAGHVDNITTSYGQISGVEINASIFQALRTGRLAQAAPRLVSAMVVFCTIVFTIVWFTRLSPRQLLLAVLSSALVLPLVSFLLLQGWQLWISPAPMILTLFVAYPLWNWLRLDAAVNFIHAQLLQLEQENLELSHKQGWSDVERAADFLQSLGHVDGWHWVAVTRQTEPETPLAFEDTPGGRTFTFGGTSRRLELQWRAGHEKFADSLSQVFPEHGAHRPKRPAGADSIRIDLAQLDLAYREARRNRDLVKGTLEQLGAGVILSDLSGDLVLVNEKVRSLLALKDEPAGLLELLHRIEFEDAPNPEALVDQLLVMREHFSHEGRAVIDGRDLLCRGAIINLERPMLLVVLTDVAELKQSERRRVEALNFLSHDLRAPLTSVLALIDSARQDGSDNSDLGLLEEIETYIRRNLSYAENFIQMARINHTEPPRFDQCHAHSLVDNAVAQLFHTAARHGIELQIAYTEEDIWLSCNRGLVERALLNLIDNALKHSPSGGIVEVLFGSEADCVYFAVEDQGRGIVSGEMQRIFRNFEQGSGARTGVGLGLRLVSAVANMHAGKVSAENRPTGGSRFTLRLPLAGKAVQ